MSMDKKHLEALYEEFHSNSKRILSPPDRNNFTYRHVIKFLTDNTDLGKPKKILDIGCGVGSISFFLSTNYPNSSVTGLDISKKAIDACLEYKKLIKSKNTSFSRLKVENYTNHKQKFDIIIASEVIEHLVDDKKFIENCSKLLDKNGALLITTPSKNAPLFKLGLLKSFDRRVGHIRRYEMAELKKIINLAGFKIKDEKLNEGILRNFLFTNKLGGFLLKFVNKFLILNNILTYIDNFLIKVFGESNIYTYSIKQ